MARRNVRWRWGNKPRVEVEFSVEVPADVCIGIDVPGGWNEASNPGSSRPVNPPAGGIYSGFSGDEGIAPSTPLTGPSKRAPTPPAQPPWPPALRGRGRLPSTPTFQLTSRSTTGRICLLYHTQCSVTAPAPLPPAPGAWPRPPAPTPSPCPRPRASPTASWEVCLDAVLDINYSRLTLPQPSATPP